MTFYRGQKVTMVRDWPEGALRILRGETIPRLGEVYSVRGFYRHPNGREGLFFEEIVNAPREYFGAPGLNEIAFSVEFFRPVVEPKRELPAEITALLDTKNHAPLPQEAFV